MEKHQLEGLWTYIAYETGGETWPSEMVTKLAKLVLLVGEFFPGWHGLWGVVTYGYQGGTWSELEIKAWCRDIILGSRQVEEPVATDFHLSAGGRFRLAAQESLKEIDLEQFWKGTALLSVNLGLYSLESERLTLCLAEPGHPRPSGFSSREHAYQSLGVLVRIDLAVNEA